MSSSTGGQPSDIPLPKGGFRKKVSAPAARAAGPKAPATDHWLENRTEGDAEDVFLCADYCVTDAAVDFMRAPMAVPPAHGARPVAPEERCDLGQFKTSEYTGIAAVKAPWRITRAEVFATHLYCGFRRRQDFQDCLQTSVAYQDVQTVIVITVLSIDVAIDSDRCDLMKSHNLATFTAVIYSRHVIVSGGGPPCETWSAARWSDDSGPPPLRTHDSYWGIKDATER